MAAPYSPVTARYPGVVRRAAPHPDLAMLLVCLIWGINFSMLKFGMQTLSPFTLTAARYLIATAVLWLVVRWLEPGVQVERRVAWRLMGLGVLGNTLYQAGFAVGLTMTTASNSSLLIASTPLVTALVGAGLGLEKLTRPVVVAIGLGTAGVVLIVLGSHGTDFSMASMRGDALTIFAVCCWAFFTHGVRHIGAADVSPLQSTLLTTVGGTPGLVLLGLPGMLAQDWTAVSLPTWGALLYAALLSIVLCYMLWTRSVRVLGANRTALWGLTTPVFALTAAALMLGETITAVQVTGAVLIMGSVAVNLVTRRGKAAAIEPVEEGV